MIGCFIILTLAMHRGDKRDFDVDISSIAGFYEEGVGSFSSHTVVLLHGGKELRVHESKQQLRELINGVLEQSKAAGHA